MLQALTIAHKEELVRLATVWRSLSAITEGRTPVAGDKT